MKVSELLTEETVDDYIKRLTSSLNIKRLGSGAYADVFQHPMYNNVAVKTFVTKEDPDYLKYIQWCLKNQNNPWVPKIVSIESRTIDYFETSDGDFANKITIVFFEKLRKATKKEIKAAVQLFIKDFPDSMFYSKENGDGTEYHGVHRNEIEIFQDFQKEDWEFMAKYSKDSHIKKLTKKLASLDATDVHDMNVMVDSSGQLVFIDPVAS